MEPAGRAPLVSVVTPVFNGERWIEACIRSVEGQDYPAIEHIVMDGGSTDRTVEICRAHPRLRVISEPDRGQSDAINKGMAIARGEILAWLCADDEYLPGAVSAAVRGVLDGREVVMGWSRLVDAEGRLIREHESKRYPAYTHDMLLRFWRYPTISQPAVFWRREIWERCGPLREDLHLAMDYDLWLRMTRETDMVFVPQEMAIARVHPEAKCAADRLGACRELLAVSRGYWPTSRWTRLRLTLSYRLSTADNTVHDAEARALLGRAGEALDRGDRRAAWRFFRAAHRRHWAAPLVYGYAAVAERLFAANRWSALLWRASRGAGRRLAGALR